jgi:hypothetical protein
MIRALRLGDDELTTDQLEGLAREHPEPHYALVLDALPAPDGERCLHAPTVAGESEPVKRRRSNTLAPPPGRAAYSMT